MELKLAVDWIAANDNAGNGDSVEEIQDYMTVMLVADVFGKAVENVALKVAEARVKAGLEVGDD